MSFAIAQIHREAWRVARPGLAVLGEVAPTYVYAVVVGAMLSFLAKLVIAIPELHNRWLIAVALLTGVFVAAVSFRDRSRDVDLGGELGRVAEAAALKKAIVEYAGRLPDWDGTGGTAPGPDAIADALAFIDQLPDRAPMPDKVYAPGDGEVMFQWVRRQTLVEIGFYGDDTISWYARLPDRDVSHGDDPFDRRYGRRIPEVLTNAICAVI